MESVQGPFKQALVLSSTALWHQVDCRDMTWPGTMRDLCRVRGKARVGDVIEVVSGLLVTPEKLRAWCDAMGDRLVRTERGAEVLVAQIQIAGLDGDCSAKPRR